MCKFAKLADSARYSFVFFIGKRGLTYVDTRIALVASVNVVMSV